MNIEFYNKVIDLIPSSDLRQYIKEHDFIFGDKELLKIILDESPLFETKIQLFKEAANVLSDKEMRELAERRLKLEIDQFNSFMDDNNDTVYEIKIKLKNEVAEETFITKTFNDAIELIKKFIKCFHYTAKDRVDARYIIEKKATFVPATPDDIFNVGTVGSCVLDSKYRIITLDMYNAGSENVCEKGAFCYNCQRCINVTSIHFPHFLNKYDLIAYYDDIVYDPKHLTYGILYTDMEECDYDSYVISIVDNDSIKNKTAENPDNNGFYHVFDAHHHPSFCTIIKPELKTVPKDIYHDYIYAVKNLKRIDNE